MQMWLPLLRQSDLMPCRNLFIDLGAVKCEILNVDGVEDLALHVIRESNAV